jgi:general secretion pathway protein G
MNRNTNRRRSAFTLIELLVVIVILAILAVVVIPRVTGRVDDAKISAAITTVKTLDNSIEQYKLDTGNYPTSDQGLQALVNNTANNPRWNGPYLKQGIPNDPWGNPFQYRLPSEHGGDYDVFSAGADGQPGTADDIGNWSN